MRRNTQLLIFVLALAIHLGPANAGQEQSTSPAPAAFPEALHIPAGVSGGLLIKKVNPEYPKKARKKRIQGTVLMRAKINKQGDIENLYLISGDPLLAAPAMKAVKQWKYRPYFLNGEPVIVDTEIRVNFQLAP